MRTLAKIGLVFILAGAAGGSALAAARCDGCSMFLAPHGKTLHRIISAPERVATFCSFSCLADALERAAVPPDRIEAADFATGAFVDARTAVYVEGSDAPPLMDEISLVAFGTAEAAAAYRGAHGGAAVSFRESLEKHRARSRMRAAVAATGPQAPRPVFEALPGQGTKVRLDAERHFVFSFDKKPTMGTAIAKVEILAAGGRKDTSFEIRGNADMPSMGCQRGKPDRTFSVNKKGVYLLPFTFGMPGDWEVYLTFVKDGAVVYRGKYAFGI